MRLFYPKLIIILSLAFLIFFMLYIFAVDSPYRISSSVAKKMIKNSEFDLILDVRTDLERNTLGYYSGSIHIQSADLEKIMPVEYPNKNIRILAYCNTGHRERLAVEKLHSLGYNNALYIATPYTTIL
jgi:rhodanese-related sulfurtransferase